MNEDQIIDGIIEREGGLVNHPADRGGATKFGITQKTLSAYLGRPATADRVRKLTKSTARDIYRKMYIRDPGFNHIKNIRVRVFLIDSGINHGPVRPIYWLQRIVGVPVDGILGPNTAEAANTCNSQALFERLVGERLCYYGKIITKNRSQAVFAHGWMNRIASFLGEQT